MAPVLHARRDKQLAQWIPILLLISSDHIIHRIKGNALGNSKPRSVKEIMQRFVLIKVVCKNSIRERLTQGIATSGQWRRQEFVTGVFRKFRNSLFRLTFLPKNFFLSDKISDDLF